MRKKISQLQAEIGVLHDVSKSIVAVGNLKSDEEKHDTLNSAEWLSSYDFEVDDFFGMDQDAGDVVFLDDKLTELYDANESKIKELQAEIKERDVENKEWQKRLNQMRARDEQVNAGSQGLLFPTNQGPVTIPDGGVHSDSTRSHSYELFARARQRRTTSKLKAFTQPAFCPFESRELSPDEQAFRFGMFGLAYASSQLPGRYQFPKAEQFVADYMNVLAGSNGASGGQYAVPDEFMATLIDLQERFGVARRLFRIEPMGSDTKTVPRWTTDVVAYHVGENAAGTESTPTIDDIRLVAQKIMVLSRLSKEIDEDSPIDFGDKLMASAAHAFASREDDDAFNGDGTSTYGGTNGVRNKLVGKAGLKTQASGNTWGALTLADFEGVIGVLPQYAEDMGDPVWVCHRTFYYTVMAALANAAGGNTNMAIARPDNRQSPVFLGYPVEFSQKFPSATAVATVSCALGAFDVGCIMGDRRQQSMEFDDTVVVGGQSVWERDQIAMKATERVDFNCFDLGDASTPGSVVGLRTGA